MVGAAKTVKSVVDVAVSPCTVTAIFPVVAPAGTATVSCVADAVFTVADMPLILTTLSDGVVEKNVPVIVTVVPTLPAAGAKEATVGELGTTTIKSVVDVAVSPCTVTAIFPVVAPAGTVTVSCVADAALTVADVPLILTTLSDAVFEKNVPVIVTVVPTLPEAGAKEATVGGSGITVKSVEEVATVPFTVI